MRALSFSSRLLLATGFAISLSIGAAVAGPVEDYLDAQLRVVRGLEKRVDSITDFADETARGLVAGGNIYLAGEPGMISELLGRAGGLCGAKALASNQPPKFHSGDVVLFADFGLSGDAGKQRWNELVASRVLLIAFASSESPIFQKPLPANVRPIPVDIPRDSRLVTSSGGLSRFLRREGCCDANVFDRRENGTVPLAPPSGERLIPTAAPAISIAEWTFTAELIGACRRQHCQLAVYLSIFLDEGHRRLKRTQGLLFEPELRPATVAQGQYAREFLAAVSESLTAIRSSELEPIHRAAGWLREASAAKRKIVRNFQGHLPPKEAGTPGDAPFFSAMVSSMGEEGAAWIRSHLYAGDVYLFLGYQQNEDAMARAASALGAQTIFLTSRRPGPQVAADPLHIDVNPHWPVTDACLDLPGYDVKACPLSAIAGLTCYYAICAEAIRR